MLYDYNGREIPVMYEKLPAGGLSVNLTSSDRYFGEKTTSLTPYQVGQILECANSGDSRDQSKLAMEITEKDWDINQTVLNRRMAVSRTKWHLEPGQEKSPKAQQAAIEIENILRNIKGSPEDDIISFDELIAAMMTSLLPGFSVNEVIWKVPGEEVYGFQFIEPHNFTFQNSRRPLMVLQDQPQGVELPAYKFIFHKFRHLVGDTARGGLIRPLAWLYAFRNLNFKDAMRYMEKFGMPFIAAKLDANTWKNERNKIATLVQNFGSDGAGVFSNGVDIEFIESKVNAEGPYFKFMSYTEKAIQKVVLGQTSTSTSESSNRSTAEVHMEVKEEYRSDDCDGVADTLNSTLINWLTIFKYGTSVPAPRMVFDYNQKSDRKLESEIIGELETAGYEVDTEQIQEKTGYRVKRKQSVSSNDTVAMSANAISANAISANAMSANAMSADIDKLADSALADFLESEGLVEWFGPLQKALDVALSAKNQTEFDKKLKAVMGMDLYSMLDSTEFQKVIENIVYTAYAQGTGSKINEISQKMR